jgi:signal transduction histidine kinase
VGIFMENWKEQMIADVERLYGSSDQPAAVVDKDLMIVWVNKAALQHYETLRMPDGIRTLVPGEYVLRTMEALARRQAQVIAREEIPLFSASLCFTPLGRQPQPLLSLVNFQPLAAGGPYSDSGGANRMIAAFSGNIRGPLGLIFSALSSLSRNAAIRRMPALYKPLQLISRQSYQILRHCVNLTEFARFGSALHQPSLQVCDLKQLLSELCESARKLTQDIGIPLFFSAEQKNILCLCDAGMLQTVFFNLLSNCCRYTKEGNVIRIALQIRGKRAFIRISDRGTGIPEEFLPRVFEPFFSLPGRDGNAGCGLGLTVARMCMVAQRGTLSIQSKQGEGTAVALSLPLAAPSEEPMLRAPAAVDLLCDRFSSMYILLSDVCSPPDP